MQDASKVLIQTSKYRPHRYVISKIRSKIPSDWKYYHFLDHEILDFFEQNRLEEFFGIAERFHSFTAGAHRADLFRYYYLYLNGGVYVDSDVMLEADILGIIREFDFVTVLGTMFPGTVFNGFLYCKRGCPIVYEALRDLYLCEPEALRDDYFHSCRFLHDLLVSGASSLSIGLYKEAWYTDRCLRIVDDKMQTVMYHFWIDKVIPRSKRAYYAGYFLRSELWALLRHYALRLLPIPSVPAR